MDQAIDRAMKLADDEREVVVAELDEVLGRAREPESRRQLSGLREEAERGQIPADQIGYLERLIEVGLESGRIRSAHTAHGEMAALRLYRRTPRGQAIQKSLEAVSQALSALAGQTLEELSLSFAGPGKFSLTVSTDQGRVLVQLDRGGAELRSLEVG